jgi:hypothetical protein
VTLGSFRRQRVGVDGASPGVFSKEETMKRYQ